MDSTKSCFIEMKSPQIYYANISKLHYDNQTKPLFFEN